MGVYLALLPAAALAAALHRKIEETYALTAMGLITVLLFAGLCNQLQAGVIAALALSLLCFPLLLISIVRDRQQAKRSLCTAGGLYLILFLAFFAVFCYHRDLYATDDLRVWGLMAKRIYQTNRCDFLIGGYPKGMALWEYYAAKTSGGYQDGVLLFAHATFQVSLMMPLFTMVQREDRRAKGLFLALCLFFIPGLGETGTYAYVSLYNDAIIGLLIFYSLFYLWKYLKTGEKSFLIFAFAPCWFLPWVKRTGILLASILLIIEMYVFVLQGNRKRTVLWCCIATALMESAEVLNALQGGTDWKYLLIPPVSIAGTGLFLLERRNIRKIREKDHLAPRILQLTAVLLAVCLVACRLLLFSVNARNNVYWQFWMLVPFVKTGAWGVSIGHVMLLSVIVYYILNQRYGDHPPRDWDRVRPFLEAILFGCAAYILAMLLLQIYYIAPGNDDRILRQQERYLNSMTRVLYLSGVAVFLKFLDHIKGGAVLVLTLILLTTNSFDLYTTTRYPRHRPDYDDFKRASITLDEKDRIFFIDEVDEDRQRDLDFAYYVYPAATNFQEYFGALDGSNTLGPLTVSCSELENLLIQDEYDYVFLYSCDDEFADRYGTLFRDPDEIESLRGYKVSTDEAGQVQLAWVGSGSD